MKPLTTDEIRSTFLGYFAERGHEVVASSPLVPQNDPSLLFVNSGMVQFKDVFTGKETRPYKRATTSQKCVRAGGKHNDLENVGYTPRHHTFFEMLGNFSFGDYFKEAAIQYAWDLTTKVYGLPKDRLVVSVFAGDDQIPADDEAAALWTKAGVPAERIFRFGRKDNYWQMGETGPQGPCSEIYYFVGDDLSGSLDVGRIERSDGWIEIWNLVFMQFFRDTADGALEKLPKPSVDTGAGLERLAMVLQGVPTNYDTDAFRASIDAISDEVKKPYRGGADPDAVSMRVIADHSRAAAFLIADGVQPGNEGREYVLRRIMRRAIRHGSKLGFDDLFFFRACERVIDRMRGAYPDMERARALVSKVAAAEETSFRRTLDRGLKLLNEEMGRGELSPEFVATLYHTYGFPIDLTRVIASERGMVVDEEAAQQAVVAFYDRDKPKAVTTEKVIDRVWFDVREKVGATAFVGYETDDCDAAVTAIVAGGAEVERAHAGDEVFVVLDRTPFYGESGGQVGDRGVLGVKGTKVEIRDTLKPRPDMHVHAGRVLEGELRVGDRVEAKIDRGARESTRKNHSATHLLHLALKEVLGAHVQQKGSLVGPDRLRFDYTHFEPVTPDQVAAIERRVNAMVLEDAPTETEVGSMERARSRGAVMLFGEKYGDSVRMVRIGGDSLELCGGTHVRRAGEIGLVKIVSDAAIAAGVRRLEAVTGLGALTWAQDQKRLLDLAAALTKSSAAELPDKIAGLLKRTKELERALEKAKADAAMAGGQPGGGGGGGDLTDRVEDIGGVRVLLHRADRTPVKSLREVSDRLRDKMGSGVVVLGTSEEDKAAILVAVTKDLTGRVNAGTIVREAAKAMGGSGGGRPDFAQGGGKAELLDAGLQRAREMLASGN